jgi:hypothetical protein
MRTAAGIAAGALIALVVIALIEWLGSLAIPVAADRLRPSGGAEPLFDVPVAAKLIVVFAWFAGALLGGLLARRISGASWSPWAVGGLVAAAGIVNIFMIPHATWMQFAALVVPLLGGLAACHLPFRSTAARGWK